MWILLLILFSALYFNLGFDMFEAGVYFMPAVLIAYGHLEEPKSHWCMYSQRAR